MSLKSLTKEPLKQEHLKAPKTLEIETSPHLSGGTSVEKIMRNVVFALLPTAAFAIYSFGLSALLCLAVAITSCVLTEHILCRSANKASTVGDWSATVTGLLFALTLPPGLPLWMVACGGMIAIALGKILFGGLGYNAFNPALVARAFLQAAFPVAMTSWAPAFTVGRFYSVPESTLTLPFAAPHYDALTGATPLALMKFDQQLTENVDLIIGLTSGSYGETNAILILLGGLWLVARNMMNWRIPLSIFVTVAVLSALLNTVNPNLYPGSIFMLFSGGLMLGAVFMATDMVASPMTSVGVVCYGILIGTLVVVIRSWGAMPEGVMYSILLANACAPHIDNLTQARAFGNVRFKSTHKLSHWFFSHNRHSKNESSATLTEEDR